MVFKTIVPQQSVVVGESFQVQFTMQDDEEVTNFKAPAFAQFRIVTGPHVYFGSVSTINGIKPLTNTVYTLVALRPGRFMIPGATAISNGEIIRSNEMLLEVISKEEAIKRFNRESGISSSDYFLRPGEDGYEKIKKNLFLKVMVDKKNCYVGEPVLATFKLYSRLESKSDIVKNPGFYGFTVYDMVSLSDKQATTEKLNGKLFDVHTIRKVQLYPLQAGDFTIDPMEVRNKVEFSRSAVSKKTEQEIVEGVLGYDEEEMKQDDAAEVFETEMHTAPVMIHVNPPPVKAKPMDFNGAVGAYTIRGTLSNEELGRNEQGTFELIIAGKGNFTQLDAPVVKWPAGVEGFAPVVKDVLDKSKMPLAGQRVFRFAFVAANPGLYTIPQISFSFYNPDSGNYKTISTKALTININNTIKTTEKTGIEKSESVEKGKSTALFIVIVLISAAAGIIYFRTRKKEEKTVTPTVKNSYLSVEEIMIPASAALKGDDKSFYSSLLQSASQFFSNRFDLSGSEMNKERLLSKMQEKKIDGELIKNILGLLEKCETGIYTNLALGQEKSAMFDILKELMVSIDSDLLKQV